VELRSFQGVISACLTPNGRYRERIPELVDFHLKHGVRGFFVLGTTGEGVKLSKDERAEVAETAVEYVGSRGLVIIHAGAADLSTTKWLVNHASRIGADAVAAIAPFYHRYDVESLVSFYQELAKTSSIPLLVYNNPERQGYVIPVEGLLKILESLGPGSGLKDSSGDPAALLQLQNNLGATHFLAAGSDKLMAYAFMIGYRAHVSAIASVCPELASSLYKAVKDGDVAEAFKIQAKLNRVNSVLKKTGPDLAAYRYALKLRGVDLGEPIPPTRKLSAGETEFVEGFLRAEGLV
jgi:dihydrodipicolinate synthase/N-acetylneuraminate lyase